MRTKSALLGRDIATVSKIEIQETCQLISPPPKPFVSPMGPDKMLGLTDVNSGGTLAAAEGLQHVSKGHVSAFSTRNRNWLLCPEAGTLKVPLVEPPSQD